MTKPNLEKKSREENLKILTEIQKKHLKNQPVYDPTTPEGHRAFCIAYGKAIEPGIRAVEQMIIEGAKRRYHVINA